MQVENKTNCTGCGACYNACPVNAITMQGDEYGFYKPFIDKEKCINCDLCEKTCPLYNYKSKNDEPKAFALINKDETTRLKCASGGAFAAFAKSILEKNGITYGVIWNNDIVAVHSKAENIEQLEKMYSSKYVQSNTLDTFKQAKTDLENNKKVLLSGTPCQIAGLKSYLKKDYENLFTIDLICHGTPSPLILEKYKQEILKNKADEKIININFRSKKRGWGSFYTLIINTNKKEYCIDGSNSSYLKAFGNLSLNTSCVNCQFNKIPRVADITIGDFWGVDEYDESLNDKKGLSIILINNKKGQNLLNEIEEICKLQEVPLGVATKRNPNIYSSSKAHKNREEFLDYVCIKNKTLKSGVQKYLKTPIHIVIYRLLPQFMKDFIKYKIMKMEK